MKWLYEIERRWGRVISAVILFLDPMIVLFCLVGVWVNGWSWQSLVYILAAGFTVLLWIRIVTAELRNAKLAAKSDAWGGVIHPCPKCAGFDIMSDRQVYRCNNCGTKYVPTESRASLANIMEGRKRS